MITLELADVSKRYKSDSWVLRKISVTIPPGLFALIGPNGAGKTTVLRLLGGLLLPCSGSVLFNGQDISRDYQQYKQLLGYLPQEFGLYPDMTGREFLSYMSRIKGIPSVLHSARVEEIAECAGVHLILDLKIGSWSAGQKRRLGIAQALLNDPDIIILDEPMVGLDFDEKLFFWNYFYELSKQRIIVLSSNTLSDFLTCTDRVLLLVNGRLHFNGHMQDLIDCVDGKVWTVNVPVEMVQSIANKWVISGSHYAGNRCQARIVSDTAPDIAGVQLTEPKVEDAYIYVVERNKLSLEE